MCADSIRNDNVSIQLIPHPSGRSTHWYIRVHVPKEIQQLVGKKEVRRSTGTSNRTEARAIGARIEASLRDEWRQLARSNELVRLTPTIIAEICASRVASWSATDEADRVTVGFDDEEEQEARTHSDSTIQYMSSVLARGPKSESWPHVREMAIEYAVDVGYNIAPEDPLLPKFVRAFAQAEKSTQEVIARRNDGTDAAFVVPYTPGPKLSELIEPYENHRRGAVEQKTISKSVSIWRRLVEFLNDCPIEDVSSKDIYDFLHARLHATDGCWSQGYVDGHAKRALKEFFSLARTKGLMRSENPLDRLEMPPRLSKKEQQKRLKPRYPFSVSQLNTLFASYWYDANSCQVRGKMLTDLAARYWCPLISTCHGLRVREVVQLVNSDFTFVEGVLLVTFQTELTSDEGTALPERKLKNHAALRTIPVHPKLLELGLAEFVRAMQAKNPPETPMFPSAIPEAGNSPLWGRAYEQSFLRLVRDKLKFGSGFGNHSFRHQLEDRVRDAQLNNGVWPAGLGELLTGRKLPRTIDREVFREQSSAIAYGNGYSPPRTLSYVAQIAFDGVTFPPCYDVWLAKAQ